MRGSDGSEPFDDADPARGAGQAPGWLECLSGLDRRAEVFIGEGAANILRAAQFWGSGVDLHEAGHLHDRVPFTLGPFTITPYLADPPSPVYAILMEGTSFQTIDIDPDADAAELVTLTESEVELELELHDTLMATAGLVVVLGSAQNIDRLVTVYRAALRSDRVRDRRLYPEQLRERAGRLVLFGAYQGEIPSLIRDGLLTGGAVIWSMWDYLDEPSGQRLQAVLKSANVPLIQHHTSGHATPADLVRLVEAMKPDVVVPIPTEALDAYANTVGNMVKPHADGTWWTV